MEARKSDDLLSACLRGAVEVAGAVLLLIVRRLGGEFYFESDRDG